MVLVKVKVEKEVVVVMKMVDHAMRVEGDREPREAAKLARWPTWFTKRSVTTFVVTLLSTLLTSSSTALSTTWSWNIQMQLKQLSL